MPTGPAADLEPAFLTQMVESVGVGVGIYGADGRYIYVNDAYASLFGVAPAALVGTPLWEIVPAIEEPRFGQYWASFANGETRSAETIHQWKGREVPVATVTTQHPINGTPYHFGTIKDISERRAKEQELARQNERLENFASVVSHDLRNPLNVAQGYAELLRDDIDRDELHLIENALERMDVLITELLELARSGQGDTDDAVVELTSAATDAWDTVDTPNATLHTPDGERLVHADLSRLQQLFENLFRNAIDHGGADVAVTVTLTPDGFIVDDTGPGIPSAERDHVFEAGYTTAHQGTGFGLSIVQQIVSEHGWGVLVTESPSGGARFVITGVEPAD